MGAAQALSKSTHGAEDGNHNNAAVQASQKVEAAMRRIQPLSDPDNEDLLIENGPKDQPDVDEVQSNERRDFDGDDGPRKPPVQSANRHSRCCRLPYWRPGLQRRSCLDIASAAHRPDTAAA